MAERRGPLAWLPRGAIGVLHEITRHLLRRPVVGICAVAKNAAGELLLVRRADTGGWALPGGTLEWGEQLSVAIGREVEEETGAEWVRLGEVSGVYSRQDRDPRFHAVTICVTAEVKGPLSGPKNPMEIREARFFAADEIPVELSMGMSDMLSDADREGVVLE